MAPAVYAQLEKINFPNSDVAVSIQTIEPAGLSIFCGSQLDRVLQGYGEVIAQTSGVARQAELRIAMAGWLYRAGHIDEAVKQLELANQESPITFVAQAVSAWAFSDLGRQADALAVLPTLRIDPAESDAVSALIHWRTEERDLAKREFTAAVEADPVWMEPHWAANNYSAKAAAVFTELRAAEVARRKEEEAKKRREAAKNQAASQ